MTDEPIIPPRRSPDREGFVQRATRFARDIASNYDHDADAHRYGHADSQCRVCKAEQLLAEFPTRGAGVTTEEALAVQRLIDYAKARGTTVNIWRAIRDAESLINRVAAALATGAP